MREREREKFIARDSRDGLAATVFVVQNQITELN